MDQHGVKLRRLALLQNLRLYPYRSDMMNRGTQTPKKASNMLLPDVERSPFPHEQHKPNTHIGVLEELKNDQPKVEIPQNLPESEEAFTSFTRSQLRGLRLLLGFSAITSPLTATIYFPLLPLLRAQFNTSAQGINLTLTIYIVFQAISPVVFGPLSDTYGRRPIFLYTLALYLISNIGLAVNERNYVVLLVVRAFQSLGASAAYAIAFGVVADVCTQSERGRMRRPYQHGAEPRGMRRPCDRRRSSAYERQSYMGLLGSGYHRRAAPGYGWRSATRDSKKPCRQRSRPLTVQVVAAKLDTTRQSGCIREITNEKPSLNNLWFWEDCFEKGDEELR